MLTVDMDWKRYDLTKLLAGDPKARSKQLADFAEKTIDEAVAVKRASGRSVRYDTFVDGRYNAPLQSVRPDGIIAFEFKLIDDVIDYIRDELIQNSPIWRGNYAASHALYADNTRVLPNQPLPPASEYVFVNLQPYSRKIEKGLSSQAPDGVYQGVAGTAYMRFRNQVESIYFAYRAPMEGAISDWATGKAASKPSRRAHSQYEYLARQPAIVILP